MSPLQEAILSGCQALLNKSPKNKQKAWLVTVCQTLKETIGKGCSAIKLWILVRQLEVESNVSLSAQGCQGCSVYCSLDQAWRGKRLNQIQLRKHYTTSKETIPNEENYGSVGESICAASGRS